MQQTAAAEDHSFHADMVTHYTSDAMAMDVGEEARLLATSL